jgi:hypothetical protein
MSQNLVIIYRAVWDGLPAHEIYSHALPVVATLLVLAAGATALVVALLRVSRALLQTRNDLPFSEPPGASSWCEC